MYKLLALRKAFEGPVSEICFICKGAPGVPFSFIFCFMQNYCNVFLCFKIVSVSLQNFPALKDYVGDSTE